MDAVNHLLTIRVEAIGNEDRGDERRRCHAETDRHLLRRAGNGARAAGLRFGDVGIDQRVHAGVLQRREKAEAEHVQHDQPDRRSSADGGEEQDEHAKHHRVGNQHLPVAKTRKDVRHGQLETHGGERGRHHEQPGLDGGESEPNLVEKRKQERDPADSQAREEAAADCGAERADAKQRQAQQGMRDAARVQSVTRKKERGKREQRQHFPAAQRVLAEHLEHIRQQRDAGTEQDEADNVRRMSTTFAVVREIAVHQIQADEADRNVDKKDHAPVEMSDDQAADDGPEHRTDQTGYRDEAHGAHKFGFCERSHHGQPADRQHEGAAAALQDAGGNQEMDVAGDAAEN